MEIDENYYTDYAKGIDDCLAGKPHKADQGDRYDEGFDDQYTLEEVISHG